MFSGLTLSTGEARETRTLRDLWWRFLGRTEVHETRSLHQTQILRSLPLSNVARTLYPFLSSNCILREILQHFLKPSSVLQFGGNRVKNIHLNCLTYVSSIFKEAKRLTKDALSPKPAILSGSFTAYELSLHRQ